MHKNACFTVKPGIFGPFAISRFKAVPLDHTASRCLAGVATCGCCPGSEPWRERRATFGRTVFFCGKFGKHDVSLIFFSVPS